MRAAHVIKGASANLMCHQLQNASLLLETAARECHEAGGISSPPAMQQLVQQRFLEMKQAVTNYALFLQSIGV
jgi:HPt (histidine-containing phosphotransfer) domain-containing protein